MQNNTAEDPSRVPAPQEVRTVAMLLLVIGSGLLVSAVLMLPAALFVHWATLPALIVLLAGVGCFVLRRSLLKGVIWVRWLMLGIGGFLAAMSIILFANELSQRHPDYASLIVPGVPTVIVAALVSLLFTRQANDWYRTTRSHIGKS